LHYSYKNNAIFLFYPKNRRLAIKLIKVLKEQENEGKI